MSCEHSIKGKCQIFDGLNDVGGVDDETGDCMAENEQDPICFCEKFEEE